MAEAGARRALGFAAALEAAAASPGVAKTPADPSAAGLDAAAAALEAAPAGAAQGVLRAAAGFSPFLGRLARRDAAWLAEIWSAPVEATRAALIGAPAALAAAEPATSEWMAGLREQRRRVALFAALADLGGVDGLEETTALLSGFAEAALDETMGRLVRAEAARGALPSLNPTQSGLFALAMGKLGARELNYSSDIDIILLFEEDALAPSDRLEAKDRFSRLARELVRQLSGITADGYVARVDLRLRPDPGATPPCLSTDAAELYYEAMGRTWERAAHIKARPVAGDRAAARRYLQRLEPFIWRRHLDFAAIEDAAAMLSRIREHEGGAEIAVRGQDLKLGAGGIREIEFFAQTEQMILGGRDRRLRSPRTRDALRALVAAGRLDGATAASLDAAYGHLRRFEHRLQMVEDQQTHRAPAGAEAFERIAAAMGAPSGAALEAETLAHMRRVRASASRRLDKPVEAELAAARAAAVEAAAAFPDPERAANVAKGWFEGESRALRSQRAQARMRRFAPELLSRLAQADDPMRALIDFDRFLAGLPAGVQLLSLLEAAPWVLDLITDVCAAAPKMSRLLARRPALLDAVLDVDFFAPPPPADALEAELSATLAREADYERRLDAARRWAAERRFQIGLALLRGESDHRRAQAGYSDVAEAALRAIWPFAEAEVARLYGAPPGRGAAALAMGKLGSREMTAASDLDLIIIYDAPAGAQSDGPRALAAAPYYARLAQTLVSAIAAPTAEGVLYEVDMRLRPSGNAGPVATSLASFQRYQREDAWVWEHMALTRARAIAGRGPVRAAAAAAVAEALAAPRPARGVRRAAWEMRAKLDAAHPKASGAPWSFKYTEGGIVDLEFLAQTELLIGGLAGAGGVSATEAFLRAEAAGALSAAERATLVAALDFGAALQHVERLALDEPFRPEAAAAGIRSAMLEAGRAVASAEGAPAPNTFTELEAALRERQLAARRIVEDRLAAA